MSRLCECFTEGREGIANKRDDMEEYSGVPETIFRRYFDIASYTTFGLQG